MKGVKFFDKNYYFEALRQIRTIGVVCFIIFMLEAVFVPLYLYAEANTSGGGTIDGTYLCILSYFVALMMPFMSERLFKFMDSRKASDFYHALPIRRETMYITNILAVITWCAADFVIPNLTEMILIAVHPSLTLEMGSFFTITGDVFVLGLLLMAVNILSKCIAGNRFGQTTVFFMIIFLPRLYLLFIKHMLEMIANHVVLGLEGNILWDCSYNLAFLTGWLNVRNIIYTLVLALIYLVCGGIMFVKRKSEKAESASVSGFWALVCRVLPALTFSLLPMYMILSSLVDNGIELDVGSTWFVTLIIMYVTTAVIYFLYELFSSKKAKNVFKTAPGLIMTAGLHVLMLFGIFGYGCFLENRIPDAEDINSVSFIASNGVEYFHVFNTDAFCEDLQNYTFTDSAVINAVAEGMKFSEVDYYSVLVKIDTDSYTVYRKFYMPESDLMALCESIVSSNEFGNLAEKIQTENIPESTLRLNVCRNTSLWLEADEAANLYNCMMDELKTLTPLEQLYVLEGYADTEFTVATYFTVLYEDYDSDRINFIFYLDEELMPKSYKMASDFMDAVNSDLDPE